MDNTSNGKPYLIALILLLIVAVFSLATAAWMVFRYQKQTMTLEERIYSLEHQLDENGQMKKTEDEGTTTEEAPRDAMEPETRVVRDVEEPLYQTTYLQKRFFNKAERVRDACVSFADIADDGSFAPSELDILENARVRGELQDRLGSVEAGVFPERMRNALEDDERLDRLCATEDDELLISVTRGFNQVRFFRWESDGERSSARAFSPITNLLDLSYTFIPNIDGEDYVFASYGDAGTVWWAYYKLDRPTFHSDLMEDCSGHFLFDEETGDFENAFEYSCLREYRP